MIGVSALLRDIQIWMRYQKSSGNLFEKSVFAWNNDTVTWSILNRIQSSPRLSRSWRRRRRSPGGRCTPSWAVDVFWSYYHLSLFDYSLVLLFLLFIICPSCLVVLDQEVNVRLSRREAKGWQDDDHEQKVPERFLHDRMVLTRPRNVGWTKIFFGKNLLLPSPMTDEYISIGHNNGKHRCEWPWQVKK